MTASRNGSGSWPIGWRAIATRCSQRRESAGGRRLSVSGPDWRRYSLLGSDRRVDAAEIVRIDRPALAGDDDPAFLHQPDSDAPNRLHQRPPAVGLVAADGAGGFGRVDRPAGAALGGELQDRRFEDGRPALSWRRHKAASAGFVRLAGVAEDARRVGGELPAPHRRQHRAGGAEERERAEIPAEIAEREEEGALARG